MSAVGVSKEQSYFEVYAHHVTNVCPGFGVVCWTRSEACHHEGSASEHG